MGAHHEAQAVRAGREWAEASAEDWPLAWDTRWDAELKLSGSRLDSRELVKLIDLANREAAQRWLELVETRKALEAHAVWIYEALRGHTPAGLTVVRDRSRAIGDWQHRHFGH